MRLSNRRAADLAKLFLAALLCLLPLHSSALQLNELVLRISGDYLLGEIIIEDIGREERGLQASLPPAAAYTTLGLQYNDFIDDLEVNYDRINRRRGRLSINFPYAAPDSFDLLVEVNWGAGKLLQYYRVRLAGILPQGDGQIVARITPTRVPAGASTEQQGTRTGIIRSTDIIRTVEGDSWHNLALAIRQAYLRDESISQEQVMLALRDKNPDGFIGGNRLRLGIALSLPDYYEVSSIDSLEAQREIYRALRRAAPARPRLEILSAPPAAPAPAVATLAEAPSATPADAPQPLPADAAAEAAIAAEELDKDQRAAADTAQRLNLVKRQLQQINTLIELKTTRLFALQQEAATSPSPDFANLSASGPGLDARVLLQERLDTLIGEYQARPWFWSLLLAAVVALFTLLLFVSVKLRRRVAPRRRLMPGFSGGDRRSAAASSTRPLMFEEEEPQISLPARETLKKPARGDFLQDDLTNANLDLARAYINMGETNRARNLLEEVLNNGTPAEQDKARQLLNQVN